MNKKPHVVVIGAINMDIKGRTLKSMIPYTSNMGKVEISAGGVGRNIAENLARLGVNTTLISAMSCDLFSRFLADETRLSGVSLDHVLVTDKYPSSLFLAFLDNRGDLTGAISDMSILSAINPDFLKTKIDIINSANYVVMDADIPKESVDFVLNLCKANNVPVCVEPVSVDKAKLMLPFLDRITTVTPNREEAEVLAGIPIKAAKDVVEVGKAILDKGVKLVLITLGPEGVYYATKENHQFVPSISTMVEDSVGAGDSLLAGTIYGLCTNRSFYDAVRFGIATATLTLTTKKAVHPELSADKILRILKQ